MTDDHELRLMQRIHSRLEDVVKNLQDSNDSMSCHLSTILGQVSPAGERVDTEPKPASEAEAIMDLIETLDWSVGYTKELSLRLREI